MAAQPRPRTPPDPAAAVRPLVVTADPRLLDDLLRLAAAADVDVEVAADATAARASWLRAPLVVVGPDVAHDVGRTLPRRPTGVVLVGLDLDDAGVWERGVEVAAQRVVFLPDAQDWLVGQLADAGEDGSGGGPVVAVVGGRGGAGATTLAAALAVTALRAELAPCLVDGDPLGGGIDLVLGGEDTAGLRWPDLVSSRGRVSASTLRSALPAYEQELVVLSWDRGDLLTVPPLAMRAVLASARRGAGLVVVDLPRRIDDAGTEVLSVADLVLLVVPAEVRATAAAARVAIGLAAVAGDIRLVVRGPAPGGLAAPAVGDALGLEVLGTYRSETAVTAAAERGEPPARTGRGPLAEVCGVVLAELGLTGRAAA